VRTKIRYGPHRGNVADLWRPDEQKADVPVVVLIHGGFWRAPYTKGLMNRLARSVVEHGWAAWNIEYRRVGPLGGGGGWPATFTDVATAVDHLAKIGGVDLARVITCGHSAGGHLAFWVAGRGRIPAREEWNSEVVRIRAAVSLAGVVDLKEADRVGLGGDATAKLMGGHWEQYKQRYDLASPAALLPIGVPQVLVHGLSDQVVPPSMSEEYQVLAQHSGDSSRYIPIEGAGHREMIDPDGPGWRATTKELESLLN